jgi:hypothetical protein
MELKMSLMDDDLFSHSEWECFQHRIRGKGCVLKDSSTTENCIHALQVYISQYSDGLDDRGVRLRYPVGQKDFSLLHNVQTGSGAHSASSPRGNGASFHEGKARVA